MKLSAQQVEEHNRRMANRCPEHVRRMPACPTCARISEDMKAPMGLGMTSPTVGNRIRQSDKPLMNKLEAEWFAIINAQFPNFPRPRAQAKKYKIGNNAWYKPGITVSLWPRDNGPACETAFECKGPSAMKNVARGILTIKVAAHQWPEVRFVLVFKDENGHWQQQTVLP